MRVSKPTCFISYCREGADFDSINYLVKELKDYSRNKIDFLFDNDLVPGADLPTFMQAVGHVNGVIIILSPQYKKKVENRDGGVYTEFSEIIRRYEQQKTEANFITSDSRISDKVIQSPFCLIPIVISSSFKQSCPREIKQKLALDFSDYRAHKYKNGKTYITGETRKKYKVRISKIIAEISSHYISKSENFKISYDENLSMFFEETKHDRIQDDPRVKDLVSKIFVKTHSYIKVKRQSSYLLIGRKGSGKSTITNQLSVLSEGKYKKHIEINVNHFDLEYLYSFINTESIKSELEITINQIRLFELSWEIFIYICCMEAVVNEYQQNKLRSDQELLISPIIKFINSVIGKNILDNELNHVALYRWCYSKIFEIKEEAISTSRDGLADFSYDVEDNLSKNSIISKAIDFDALDSFNEILRDCKRRFLISLDGFDTAFDDFRISAFQKANTEEMRENKVRFELDWLRGFLHIVLNMKDNRNDAILPVLIDYCIMVPKDRFMEIRQNERDAYEYISKFHDIRWSGIELSIMLRKRLELLGEYSTNSNLRAVERLEKILDKKFPCIPKESVVSVSGHDYRIPIFIDVLRHSFWRPREILIYFAKIISVLRDLRKRNLEITQFAVSKCISDTTREIIKTEFINEFQRHCLNLTNIIEVFRENKQILEKDEISEVLNNIHFLFADTVEPLYHFNEKITFLYEIGFIGFEASKNIVNRFKLLHTDNFWFNSNNDMLEIIINENYKNCKFIIHPIFCEYLDLDTSNQRFTMNFTWDYLMKQESHSIVSG